MNTFPSHPLRRLEGSPPLYPSQLVMEMLPFPPSQLASPF